jgi:GT2 family glycosyltransferase
MNLKSSFKIGISLIAYKNPEDIQICLESLSKLNKDVDFTVLVRDHSVNSDSTKIVQIAKQFKFAEYYDPKSNDGFVAHNESVNRLITSECTHILLLNPDCIIEQKDFLATLLKHSQELNDLCLIQPTIKDFDGSIGNVGNIPQYLGMGGQRDPKLVELNEPKAEIGIVSGACLFVSVKTIQKLGHLFAPLYFMYHEDTDLSLRAHILSIPTLVSTKVEVKHDHVFGKSRFKFFYLDRNKIIFQYSYFRWWELFLLAPAVLLGEFVSFAFSILNGWYDLKLDVYKDLWAKRSQIQEEKNHIQVLLNTHGRKQLFDTLEPFVSTKDFATNIVLKIGMSIVNGLFWLNWTIFRLLTALVR